MPPMENTSIRMRDGWGWGAPDDCGRYVGTSITQRIPPFQLRKARKIGIGREQLATMFNGESCQVGIRYQIANCLAGGEHLLINRPVPLRRLYDSCTGLVQPTLHPDESLV